MKIIYYSPHPTHDIVSEVGYATHQRETIDALKGLGVDVLPLIIGGASLNEMPYKTGKPTEHSGLKKWIKKIVPTFLWISLKDLKMILNDKKSAEKLKIAIKEFQPDLVYERSEYLLCHSLKVTKQAGVKHFFEINAPFVEEMSKMEGKSFFTFLGHYIEMKKYQSADKIFVVSTVLKEFIKKKYHIFEQNIIVSPNRINSDSFLNKGKGLDLNINSDGSPIIGFVGSILPHHYLDFLIEAFAVLVNDKIKAKLLVVGEGSLLDSLKQKAKDLKIQDFVIFTGKIQHSEVRNYINLMDICVMPGSNWYGSPIKIFEYGILGKPIIAPDNGPVNDVMEQMKDGVLIKHELKDLVDAMKLLLRDENLRNELGKNFKTKIMNEYTWEKAAHLIINQ